MLMHAQLSVFIRTSYNFVWDLIRSTFFSEYVGGDRYVARRPEHAHF